MGSDSSDSTVIVEGSQYSGDGVPAVSSGKDINFWEKGIWKFGRLKSFKQL